MYFRTLLDELPHYSSISYVYNPKKSELVINTTGGILTVTKDSSESELKEALDKATTGLTLVTKHVIHVSNMQLTPMGIIDYVRGLGRDLEQPISISVEEDKHQNIAYTVTFTTFYDKEVTLYITIDYDSATDYVIGLNATSNDTSLFFIGYDSNHAKNTERTLYNVTPLLIDNVLEHNYVYYAD